MTGLLRFYHGGPYVRVKSIGPYFVPGKPVPKGTFRPIKVRGKMIGTIKHKDGEAWEQQIMAFTKEALPPDHEPIDGPVSLAIRFFMPHTKKKTAGWHTTKPDRGKLTRAVEDALERAGVYVNDSRVHMCWATKEYATERGPGVEIAITWR